MARWSGKTMLNADGIHTFNREQDLGVLDFRRVTWRHRNNVWKGATVAEPQE